MDKKTLQVIFYLVLPIFLIFCFIFAMVVAMGHQHGSGGYLEAAFTACLVISLLEVYIFRAKILPRVLETEKMKRVLESQDKSAKMLVRRDLELTQANEKLRELDQRKSEFVSIVAHQLRTPLSGIKWTLDMLLRQEFGDLNNDQKVFLMKSYESNERMIRLIDDMLGADRIDSGKLHYNYTQTQILDLFDNILYEVLPLATKKNITIEFVDRNDNIPKVVLDAEKMRAVIQNIIDNAIKYTRENGTIKISVTADKEFIKVVIKDSGIGIPKDQQKNIFSRFFRASNALKVETDGTGLGLFIVKGIVEKHGGQVWFESDENMGTTFYFTIKINN